MQSANAKGHGNGRHQLEIHISTVSGVLELEYTKCLVKLLNLLLTYIKKFLRNYITILGCN
jgi:hypothetical protein